MGASREPVLAGRQASLDIRRTVPELDRRVRRAVAEMPNLDTPTAVLADDLPVSQRCTQIQSPSQYLQADARLAPEWSYVPTDGAGRGTWIDKHPRRKPSGKERG